ncbi:hypothetical protein CDAR_214431 [Caerostris darwini]|uniref:Uncharacterized protein n=1 Tax=Caerostris darwini TaxID=1538125 RepID=A0AAV4X316_9ARAC|nr:hypothetical protein CDAR_214401 [Caerostris darwini]GIY88973.1 hypothetical protein CDAR_214431 [Caerostris darwini]
MSLQTGLDYLVAFSYRGLTCYDCSQTFLLSTSEKLSSGQRKDLCPLLLTIPLLFISIFCICAERAEVVKEKGSKFNIVCSIGFPFILEGPIREWQFEKGDVSERLGFSSG